MKRRRLHIAALFGSTIARSAGVALTCTTLAGVGFTHANVAYADVVAGTAWAATSQLAFSRWLHASAVVIAYLAFCFWIFRKHRPAALDQPQTPTQTLSSSQDLLLAYASQTGFARQLAEKTAASLQEAGVNTELLPLDAVDIDMLSSCRRALFVVSTTGEGDAPDNAGSFVQNTMNDGVSLSQLEYGVLALGDSGYANFCGFGNRLNAWLQHTNALPLFDIVEVDGDDAGALRHWQYQLGLLAHDSGIADWQTPHYRPWQLQQRRHLNPGSAGAPVYHITLVSAAAEVDWQAGDIAEIGPRHSAQAVHDWLQRLDIAADTVVDGQRLSALLAERLLPSAAAEISVLQQLDMEALLAQLKPIPHREYSIASLPQDGQLELLVRQTHYPDGRLGLGAGWLTQYAQIGDDIALRIRKNANFHAQPANTALIMIGNGTGIAGLRAHLKAQIAHGNTRNWLFFGERNAAHDLHFADELQNWLAQGKLKHLNAVFSRDQEQPVYVQDALQQSADELKRWVLEDGAAIYVCGSATGMAPAVHRVLLEVLGENAMAQLAVSGRYRRDVY